MRRQHLLLSLSAAVLAALTFTVAASAQNPHFIRASASGPNADGSLSVSFKLAGLGSTVTTTITASADANATYGCLNNGGNFPNAANKQEVTGQVTASGEFTSGQNGQITGSLTLGPPASTLVCPSGQTLVLCAVSYTNVAVSEQSGATRPIAGTFARTFFPDCL